MTNIKEISVQNKQSLPVQSPQSPDAVEVALYSLYNAIGGCVMNSMALAKEIQAVQSAMKNVDNSLNAQAYKILSQQGAVYYTYRTTWMWTVDGGKESIHHYTDKHTKTLGASVFVNLNAANSEVSKARNVLTTKLMSLENEAQIKEQLTNTVGSSTAQNIKTAGYFITLLVQITEQLSQITRSN